jgi:ABC-type polysaccharide/polyol phosphate export permease
VVSVDIFTTGKRVVQGVVFITPVIYSAEVENPILQQITHWNPLTYFVGACRDMLTVGSYNHWEGFWWSTAAVSVLFILVFPTVVKHAHRIIEKIY